MRAWFMDNEPTDQRLEHHLSPPQFVTPEELLTKTGVEYFQLNADTFATDGKLEKIREERGYSYEDELTCSKECLPDYENKLKHFFTEHLHTDEEIRFVLDGSGYFDVRSMLDEDKWIRIQVVRGDLIIIPAGIYHRFTLDTNNYIKAKRYFVGEPVWLPHNRDSKSDEMECRHKYVQKLREQGFK